SFIFLVLSPFSAFWPLILTALVLLAYKSGSTIGRWTRVLFAVVTTIAFTGVAIFGFVGAIYGSWLFLLFASAFFTIMPVRFMRSVSLALRTRRWSWRCCFDSVTLAASIIPLVWGPLAIVPSDHIGLSWLAYSVAYGLTAAAILSIGRWPFIVAGAVPRSV